MRLMEAWWNRRRTLSERGAVLLEAAIVLPVLFLLAFGALEYGWAFSDRNIVDTAGRAGARAAASMGNDSYADYWALDAVTSAINDLGVNNVTRVVIFNADTTTTLAAACAGGTPTATGSQPCNVYSGTVLANLYTTNYKTTNFGCGTGKLDNYWCPTGRSNVASSADYVGIYIEAVHKKVTYVLPGDLTLKDTFIARLEPDP